MTQTPSLIEAKTDPRDPEGRLRRLFGRDRGGTRR